MDHPELSYGRCRGANVIIGVGENKGKFGNCDRICSHNMSYNLDNCYVIVALCISCYDVDNFIWAYYRRLIMAAR
jgi:hypothetical protein